MRGVHASLSRRGCAHASLQECLSRGGAPRQAAPRVRDPSGTACSQALSFLVPRSFFLWVFTRTCGIHTWVEACPRAAQIVASEEAGRGFYNHAEVTDRLLYFDEVDAGLASGECRQSPVGGCVMCVRLSVRAAFCMAWVLAPPVCRRRKTCRCAYKWWCCCHKGRRRSIWRIRGQGRQQQLLFTKLEPAHREVPS